jgi:adhesin/invasin
MRLSLLSTCRVFAALAGLSTLGCKKEPAAPEAGSLVLVQGNLQQVQGGQELPNPIVVRVLDVEGEPLPDFPIGFQVMVGGGAVNPGSGKSNENGEVRVKWTLGPAETNQTLQARGRGLEPLTISAFALLPTDLVVAQGNLQTAKAGAALPNAVVVRVVGPNNSPMKGIAVAFQVVTGGGLISPQSGLTNALGEVTARWTLGPTAGVNSLSVSSGNLQSVLVYATGS